jgi:superfamily II DNA or RNA helicase
MPASTGALSLRSNVSLLPWQSEAATAWLASRHPTRGAGHGIIEAVTGTGKTLAAMQCMVEASRLHPSLKFAIVVPGRKLARQWETELARSLAIASSDVQVRGDGGKGSLNSSRFVVFVIGSARKMLADDTAGHDVMLVVDECHASASAKNRNIYAARTRFRVGLSATAQVATEVDELGIVIPLDEQTHARQLGPRCYRLTHAEAERRGLLPPFTLVHHGVRLSAEEQEEYDGLTRGIGDAIADAEQHGVTPGMVVRIVTRPAAWRPEQVKAASAIQHALLRRKRFLYMRPERNRVAAALVVQAFADAQAAGQELQALLFNERVTPSAKELEDAVTRAKWRSAPAEDLDIGREPDEDDDEPLVDDDAATIAKPLDQEGARELHRALCALHRAGALAIPGGTDDVIRASYTGSDDEEGVKSMQRPVGDPRRGRVLVTAKSSNQGVDFAEADLGVIVASNTSVLQRIQTLGRILRPRRVNGVPIPLADYARYYPKTLHVLYVKGTADEEIYLKTDWDELFGAERNVWRVWDFGAVSPNDDDTPPVPPMGEEEAWAWVQSRLAAGQPYPLLWPTRLPPHQPLSFSGNHIRVATAGGSNKKAPIVHNDVEIQALVDGAARALHVDAINLRSKMAVTVNHRLVVRMAPSGLRDFDARDPRNGRPIARPYLVLGQVAEMPRVAGGGAPEAEPPPGATETPSRSEQRSTPRSPAEQAVPSRTMAVRPPASTAPRVATPVWLDGIAAFIAGRGAPDPALVGALPDEHAALAMIVRGGARAVPDCVPRLVSAATAETVFAGWVRARAIGDAARAEELAADLRRRTRPNAKELAGLIAALGER